MGSAAHPASSAAALASQLPQQHSGRSVESPMRPPTQKHRTQPWRGRALGQGADGEMGASPLPKERIKEA